MGKTFVYNLGNSQPAKDEIWLEYGLFFDGTLNSKYNTLLRTMVKEGVPRKATKEEEKAYYTGSSRSFVDEQGVDNSYSNDYTNVARLWEYCSADYRIYIEGIGTVISNPSTNFENQMSAGEQDDNDGFMFGAGKAGIREKVRKACAILAEKLNLEREKLLKGENKIKLTLDVFGFSRGAAAARSFVHEVNVKQAYFPKGYFDVMAKKSYDEAERKKSENEKKIKDLGGFVAVQDNLKQKPMIFKNAYMVDDDGEVVSENVLKNGKLPKMGHLGHSLCKMGFTYDEVQSIEINIRFIGVYDTVSSYYKEASTANFFIDQQKGSGKGNKYFADDVEELGLNSLGAYEKAVHFTAMDEHRYNFALTRLPGAIEKQFPGVHCDVGGAYLSEEEVVDEIEVGFVPSAIRVKNDLQKTIYLLKRGYWGNDANERLQKFANLLIDESWFKLGQLKVNNVNSFKYKGENYNIKGLYDKLSSKRYLRKEYSFIPLLFMAEYFKNVLGSNAKKYFAQEGKFKKKFSVDEINVLKKARDYLKPYVIDNKGGPWVYLSSENLKIKQEITKVQMQRLFKIINEKAEKMKEDVQKQHDLKYKLEPYEIKRDGALAQLENDRKKIEIEAELFINKRKGEIEERNIRLQNAQGVLEILRNEYFHWSANKDWFGMNPTDDRKRKKY